MTGIMELAEASMINGMERLNVISHNLANANTIGFKRDIAISNTFESHLLSALQNPATIEAGNLQSSRATDMSSGMLKYTGQQFDFSIEGDGYFQLQGLNGNMYTRNGAFMLDASGRLVNSSGMAVLTEAGEVHFGGGTVFVDGEGQIWEDDRMVDKFRIVKFINPDTLEKQGGGLYHDNGVGMIEASDENLRVRQGYLETSNVVAMDEMVNMISTMRHFEINQHVVKGYDDMLDTAIQTLGEF